MKKIYNLKFTIYKKGFTLIEVLVAVAIIGVLAGGVLVAINPVSNIQKARDARRKSDVAQIKNVLDSYYAENGSYPAATIDGKVTDPSIAAKIPGDPLPSKSYYYESPANGTTNTNTYRLYSTLERCSDSQSTIGVDCLRTGKEYSIGSPNLAAPTPIPTPSPAPVPGYIAWWKMDGNLEDASYNWHKGTINGTVSLTADRGNQINSAYSFGGTTSDYIDTHVTIDTSQVITIMGWASIVDKNVGGYVMTNRGNFTLGLCSNPVNHYQIYWSNVGHCAVPTNDIANGSWFHWALVADGQYAFYYINGSAKDIIWGYIGSGNNGQNVFIGYNWNGSIDDVRIYDHALSQTEIGVIVSAGPQ